jgi:hypothetical protein
VSRTASRWQELARTTNDGAAAVLFWNESSKLIRVALTDERLSNYVDFEIRCEAQLRPLLAPLHGMTAELAARNGTTSHDGETT